MARKYRVSLVFPDGRETVLGVDEDTFIFDAAARAGVTLPHMCLQGWCLTCAARLLHGKAGCVDQAESLRYFPQDAEEGFVLLCTGKPRGPCRLATHQQKAMQAFRAARGLPTPRG